MLLLGIVIMQYNIKKDLEKEAFCMLLYIFMKYMNFIKVEIQCFITLFEFFLLYFFTKNYVAFQFISFRKISIFISKIIIKGNLN